MKTNKKTNKKTALYKAGDTLLWRQSPDDIFELVMIDKVVMVSKTVREHLRQDGINGQSSGDAVVVITPTYLEAVDSDGTCRQFMEEDLQPYKKISVPLIKRPSLTVTENMRVYGIDFVGREETKDE